MVSLSRMALIAAAMVPVEALAQEAASTSQRLALSPQAAGRMARGDLESLLLPGGQFLTGSHLIANEGYLYTRPIETGFPGLCQHDQIIISYSAVSQPGVAVRDQALVPYAVRTNVEYRAIQDRVKIPEKGVLGPEPFDGACNDYSGKAEGWFTATDGYTAARGYNALQAVAARLRAGTLKFAKCDYAGGETSCRDTVIAAAKGDHLGSITRCETAWPSNCFNIATYSEAFVVRTRGGDSIGPDDILSVEAEQQIVVT